MKIKGLETYINLVYFLGEVLGPDYEIALHDVRRKKHSLIAITNNHISGRQVNSSLTDFALELISNKTYLENDYITNYNGVVKNNNTLVRSSSFFIKDVDELIGILCINFDSSRYQDLSKKVLSLCHPDKIVEKNYNFEPVFSLSEIDETFSNSISDMIDYFLPVESKNKKFSKADRLKMVEMLYKKNIFKIKGSIEETAKKLNCSEATIYRYLKSFSHFDR